MANGETIFLIGIGGFLVGRAIWQSIRHRRHLAWIAALSGPIGLIGLVIDQVWPFIVAVGLLIVGEFVFQTNSEVSPDRLEELREDVRIGRRRRTRRTRSSADGPPHHDGNDPATGDQA